MQKFEEAAPLTGSAHSTIFRKIHLGLANMRAYNFLTKDRQCFSPTVHGGVVVDPCFSDYHYVNHGIKN